MATQTGANFMKDFPGHVSSLITRLRASETAAELQGLCKEENKLHEDLAEAVHFIPGYDLRRANETLADVAAERERKSESLAPRQPFRFRHRRLLPASTGELSAPDEEQLTNEGPRKEDVRAFYPTPSKSAIVIADMHESGGNVTYAPGRITGRDVTLLRLRDQTVQLADIAGAVRAVDVANCKLYIGPVSGGVHLSKLVNCEVHVAGHQIRIHESSSCKFFVLASSPPIVEDCNTVAFGPYGLKYAELDAQLATAKLGKPFPDAWRQVKDFSWMQEGHSPNWTAMDDKYRPCISLNHVNT